MPTILPTQLVTPDVLKPYPDNPRKRTRASVRKLARLIRKYGFTQAIVCDENWEILAGHGRHEAALMLGLKEVPVVRVTGLNEADKIALRISDNRVAEESSWEFGQLAVEIKGLIDLNYDLSDTAFDSIEIDRILPPSVTLSTDDEAPYPQPPDSPITRLGDTWEAGRHLITCGDSLDPWVYARVMKGLLAVMVFSDPPWNVPISGHVSGNGKTKHDEFRMASGEMTPAEFASFLAKILGHARSFSCDGSLHYICMDWRGIADLIMAGRAIYSKLMNVAIWVKNNAALGSQYRSQYEMIAIFKNGDLPHVNNIQLGRLGRNRSNVWQSPGASGFSKNRKQDLADHPTVKPVAMVADAIRDATAPGDLVLDMFGGAGTTLLAAEATGRRAAVIEIEPKFVDVTLRRFQDQTGIEPLLLPDRIPLSTIRQQRSTPATEAA